MEVHMYDVWERAAFYTNISRKQQAFHISQKKFQNNFLKCKWELYYSLSIRVADIGLKSLGNRRARMHLRTVDVVRNFRLLFRSRSFLI